jgi:hypothetical protein
LYLSPLPLCISALEISTSLLNLHCLFFNLNPSFSVFLLGVLLFGLSGVYGRPVNEMVRCLKPVLV